MAKASDNEFPSVLFAEQSSDPATPSAGTARLFVNNAATPELELIDDSGTVTTFGSGGGSSSMVFLAETTLGSSQSNIQFSSISSSYQSLFIVGDLRSDRAATVPEEPRVRVGNSTVDTGANYNFQRRYYGTANNDINTSGGTYVDGGVVAGAGAVSNSFGYFTLRISNYANTSYHKNMKIESGLMQSSNFYQCQTVARWASTSAIDVVQVYPGNGPNWVAGTHLALYGIDDA